MILMSAIMLVMTVNNFALTLLAPTSVLVNQDTS